MSEIKRIPHCSHWGAYTLLVQDEQIVGVEPFAHDPAPSPIIHSVPEWANPERRILRPMVRSGWLDKRERRTNERFLPLMGGNKQLWFIENAWHIGGRFDAPDEYREKLLAFFASAFKQE